ncbi:fumarylacetoacetate hydrolase family protein [Rhodococcoides fascians A21d2]|uniref:fumarylacetoacetate hydrolase family protein n=1 Tax=Rhodococcoides fascians TaxID=1828 RepID=UPI000564137A|nr:fumarylacetoacetate hydrolase family protein [Rhodococcus fascians]QII00286.1 fumarylacetoacetate hydrolase family protein [Rhodococcus fascians A21d2]
MRLATLELDSGETVAAAACADGWVALPARSLSDLLRTGWTVPGSGIVEGPRITGELVLPLPAPTKVICCGLNYGEHIAETGRDLPTHPTLFAKFADSLIGPTDDVVIPGDVNADWEAELAVVVGRTLTRASRAEAAEAILGYTVANDVSMRDWQRRTLQWFQGKAWDATTPVGPVVVTADEIDPTAGITITCRVNGVEVQRDSTSTLVFDSAELLSYISTFTTLRAGDLVLTGTPGGIGMAREPAWFLADGDVLETEIEAIGTLFNTVRVAEPASPARRTA